MKRNRRSYRLKMNVLVSITTWVSLLAGLIILAINIILNWNIFSGQNPNPSYTPLMWISAIAFIVGAVLLNIVWPLITRKVKEEERQPTV